MTIAIRTCSKTMFIPRATRDARCKMILTRMPNHRLTTGQWPGSDMGRESRVRMPLLGHAFPASQRRNPGIFLHLIVYKVLAMKWPETCKHAVKLCMGQGCDTTGLVSYVQ